MGDDRTSNSGNVSSQETDSSLLQCVVFFLLLSQRLIDLCHGTLERREFDHCVGNLSRPQWCKSLVQPTKSFLFHDLSPSLSQGCRVRWNCGLHPHLDRLEGTKEDISNRLGRRGSSEIYDRLWSIGEQFLAVIVFEDLVRAVLARALEAVANKGGTPAGEDPSHSFIAEDFGPGLEVGGVEFGVDLAATFDEIERRD